MASGTIGTSNNSSGMDTRLRWSTSDNSGDNSSVVTVVFEAQTPYGTFGNFSGGISIDGTNYGISGQRSVGTSWTTIGSASRTVDHNANGAKSITLSSSGGMSGTSWTSTTGSGTAVLADYVRLPEAPAAPTVTRNSTGDEYTLVSAVASSPVALTDYQQRTSYDGSAWNSWGSIGLDRTITNGMPAVDTRWFQTRGISSEGDGATSPTTRSLGFPAAPSTPTATRDTAGTTLTITSAVAPSESTITDYEYAQSRDAGSSWLGSASIGTDRVEVADGFSATTPYWFRTRAISAEGAGAWSPTVVTYGVPTSPRSLTLSRTGRNVSAAWATPSTNGGTAVTGYRLSYSTNSGSSWSTVVQTSDTNYVFNALPGGLTYLFRIHASNSAGSGEYVTDTIFVSAGGRRWNGSAFIPTTIARRWNGSAWVDLTIAKRWNGTAWVDLT
jgi:hypothetical protein